MGIKEPTGRDVFLYSTWHVGVASWLGGALAGGVLVGLNWRRVGETAQALGSVAIGSVLTAVSVWLGTLLPDEKPGYQLVWAQVLVMVWLARAAGEKQRALVRPPDEVTCGSVPRIALGLVAVPLSCAALLMFALVGTDEMRALYRQMSMVSRANSGDVEAQLTMAERMLDQKKYDAVRRWLERAEAKESAKGQRLMGWLYEQGLGTKADPARAAELYRKSAEKGDAWAQCQLAWFLERGTGTPKDLAQAAAWYRRAADRGDARGQSNLGKLLIEGDGLAKDEPAAVALFEKSAAQNDDLGEAWLAWCYENGVVKPKDTAMALSWYRKAAAHGNEFAAKQVAALEAAGRR